MKLSEVARVACFAEGCSCYSAIVYNVLSCTASLENAHKLDYTCSQMNEALMLPSDSLISVSSFDLHTGSTGEYLEQLTVPDYAFVKTPLRPVSDAPVPTTIYFNQRTKTFTSTARRVSDETLTDLSSLTDAQASRAVQFFFLPQPAPCQPVSFTYLDFREGRITHNNLGGFGPDAGGRPIIHYANVGMSSTGASIDLEIAIAPGALYDVANVNANRIVGLMSQINLRKHQAVGSPPATTTLVFSFFDSTDGSPVTLAAFEFSVFDLDTETVDGGRANEGVECVVVQGFETLTRPSENSEVELYELADGSMRACGTQFGLGSDNPHDPENLTSLQAARTIDIIYRNVHSFSLDFSITQTTWPGGRNLLFSGRSRARPPSQVCQGGQYGLGVFDAIFKVSYSGRGTCTGQDLRLGGYSALCAPPPPMPPSPPPLVPPMRTSPPMRPSPPATNDAPFPSRPTAVVIHVSPPPQSQLPPSFPLPLVPTIGQGNDLTSVGYDDIEWSVLAASSCGLLVFLCFSLRLLLFRRQRLLHITYVSVLTTPNDKEEEAVLASLTMLPKEVEWERVTPTPRKSRRIRERVTGKIFYNPESKDIVHILEGHERIVRALLTIIETDSKYSNVQVMCERCVYRRTHMWSGAGRELKSSFTLKRTTIAEQADLKRGIWQQKAASESQYSSMSDGMHSAKCVQEHTGTMGRVGVRKQGNNFGKESTRPGMQSATADELDGHGAEECSYV